MAKDTSWRVLYLLAGVGLLTASGCTNFVAQSRNAEGVTLFQRGQYQEALQSFQEATYSDPANADGYYNLGATYHRIGRLRNQPDCLARAETCYRQALERNPNHRDCHRGLAVLLIEEGRTTEAFTSIQTWATQQPSLAEPKIELARLYSEFGNTAAAKERLVEAVTNDPTNARQWAALGKIREDTGDYTQALANYQRSLELDASQADVVNRVAVLQRMATQPTLVLPPPPGGATQPGEATQPVVAGQPTPAMR